MPSLLRIPREIRDQILELVIFSCRAPPDGPTTPPQDRAFVDDFKGSCYFGVENVKYEQQEVVPNSLPLLLVNRQLSAETKSTLKRYPLSYYLDVMLVNERYLYPTWLSIPALSNRVDNVIVTFRIFGAGESDRSSGFRGGDGGPPLIIWRFHGLMEAFLMHGPMVGSKLGLQERDISINSLTLNFVSLPDTDALAPDHLKKAWLWQRRLGRSDEEDPKLSSLVMRPEWLADYVDNGNRTLLAMSYHSAEHGMMVYERIGTIRYYVDGQLRTHHALDERLAKCRHNDPSHTFGQIFQREKRVPFFWKWKKKTLEMRAKAGLPVIYPDDPELEKSYESEDELDESGQPN